LPEGALAVHAGDGGGAFGDKSCATLEGVFVVDADVGYSGYAGLEGEFVIVSGGGFVAAFDFDDDEKDACHFDLGVGNATGAKEFDPSHFEILEKAAVVDYAHGIGFGVADSEGNFMLGKHLESLYEDGQAEGKANKTLTPTLSRSTGRGSKRETLNLNIRQTSLD